MRTSATGNGAVCGNLSPRVYQRVSKRKGEIRKMSQGGEEIQGKQSKIGKEGGANQRR